MTIELNKLKTSEAGIELIKGFEGFREHAYQDQGGIWTIGYGYTKGVKEGDTITEKKATENLKIHTSLTEEFLYKNIMVPLTQYQFDALVCFIYNIGETNFRGSRLHQLLNHSCYEAVPGEMMRWKYYTDPKTKEKLISEGLESRRRLEGLVWLNEHKVYLMGPIKTRTQA